VYFSTIKVPTFLKNNPHISFGEIAVWSKLHIGQYLTIIEKGILNWM
jgi:hypothetical protein